MTSERAHREAVMMGARQKYTPKENGCGRPLKRRAVRVVKSFIQGSFWVFVLPLANYMVSFSTPDFPKDPPQHACAIFSKYIQPRGL